MRGTVIGPRVALGVLFSALVLTAPAAAATPVCVTSQPLSAAYSVSVCITTPVEGPIVSGDVPMAAEIVSGGPAITRVEWFRGAEYLLRDVEAPYELVLPTAKFVDGEHTISARVLLADNFVAQRPELPLVFANGNASPPSNTNQRSPYGGPEGDDSLVVAATGDAAGGKAMTGRVAQTVASWQPDMFLYLGDVYEQGTFTEHYNYYGHGGAGLDALRGITNPAVGNHEYLTANAAGYFDYWDNVAHHYSVDAAGWHILTLDSTTSFGQLGTSSAQYQWLQQDLAAATTDCKLAFMHHPRFSIGSHGHNADLDSVWRALADAGVDIMLAGHDHHYQRWVPLNANGQPAIGGITQFVAGAGGQSIRPFASTDSRVARSLTGDQAFGALRLTLEDGGASYEYINVDGVVKDSGTIDCDPVVPPPTTTTLNFSGSGVAGAWRTHTFSVAEPGALTATLDWVNAAADLNLSLYNAAGKRIAKALSQSQKPERITYALAAGTYKFGVGFRLASTNYTLNAVIDHGGGGGPAPPTAAITAPASGQRVTGVVPVAVAATSALDPAGALNVEVRINDGAWEFATYDPISSRYVYSWDSTGTPDGAASIQARATDSLTRTTTATAVPVTVDNITDPTTTFTFTGSGNPGNWRTHDFVVPSAGRLTATLDWNNAGADLNESLYNSAGTRIAYATGSTAKPEIITRDVAAGTYRIGIGFKLASASYTLSVVVTHQ